MSKILVYADPHICENSSVTRGKGNKYSHRLETLKETFNWINKLAVEKECKHIVCLGDLFDSSSLTADEITVAAQCNISHHIFIVGNHDANVKSLETNAVNMFEKSLIISKRCALGEEDGIPFFALPYETEEDREPLPVGELDTIIFSHNDIKGIQMGPHLSTVGFDKQEIMDSCGLFINGHLHNGGWVETGKILNLGAVTGLNFSSDASKWTPRVAIIDTMGSSIEFVENPYAYLFYSVKLNKIEELYPFLDTIPRYGYPILSIKVPSLIKNQVADVLNSSGIAFYYIRITADYSDSIEEQRSVASATLSEDESGYVKLKRFVELKCADGGINYNIMMEEIDRISVN